MPQDFNYEKENEISSDVEPVTSNDSYPVGKYLLVVTDAEIFIYIYE